MQPDTSIGPYRVVRSLGHGGMGEVALAYDSRLKRHVALKSILNDQAGSQSQLVREARAIAALVHPGIAGIHDIIEQADRSYIVMEYVEGDTLWDRLTRGAVSAADAGDYCAQLCDALAAAHDRGIIHRDLKPTNIMIGADNRVKILDFGLARRLPTSLQPAEFTTASVDLSAAGAAGTVGYMAPEQLQGQPADERSDIFSLGVVLYEMFARRRPFPEKDILAYAIAVTTRDAPAASSVNGSLSAEISAVIGRALQRDPAARHQSARALATDMNRALSATPTVSITPLSGSRRLRTNRFTHAAALAVLAMFVGGIVATIGIPDVVFPAADPGSTPAVLAIVPATPLETDDTVRAIAAGLTATVTANLSGITNLNVVPGVPAAPTTGAVPNVNDVMRRVGARWALEMSVQASGSGYAIKGSITRVDADAPVWQIASTGDALTTATRLLAGLSGGLIDADLIGSLREPERRRLLSAPTGDNEAFIEYSRGRRLLGTVVTAASLDEASRQFQRAIDRDPQFALAYAGLSESLWRTYQLNKDATFINRALDAANRAIAIDPAKAAVQLTLANVLNLTGRGADALAAVDHAIALQPASDDAHRLRGRLLVQTGKTEEGLAALRHAVALRPTYVNNHETLAFTLFRAGRLDEAEASYRRVTELAPEYAGGYQMLGTTLHRKGDALQAIGHYEHAVRLGPSAAAYSNLAYSYYETGRFQEALAAYLEAAKRDGKRPDVHRNLGDTFSKLGRPAEARAAYEAAVAAGNALLQVNASDARTIALVALSEAKLRRSDAAERHAAEAMALAPKDIEVSVKNAEVYAILRQPSRSLAALRTAIALGYDRATAAANEELRPLQDNAEFKALTDRTPPK